MVTFEPHPVQFDRLQVAIEQNGLRNIEAFNVAIGTVESYQLTVNGLRSSAHTAGQQITVPGQRLGEYIYESIDLLKIDCEGAELDILRSISDVQYPLIKRIALEYHNFAVPGSDIIISEFLKDRWFYVEVIPDRYDKDIGLILAIAIHEWFRVSPI